LKKKEKGKDFAFKDTYGKSARKQGALQEKKNQLYHIKSSSCPQGPS
jgi:hypothetical protein